MAWLGTNLASIKSQITNFTKEVLIEGSNEIEDPSEQLQVATSKIKEYEESCNSREIENERLRQELRQYCERAESNEYQAKKISSQYRALLDTKEDEIACLKHRLEEIEMEKKISLASGSPKKEKRVVAKKKGKQQNHVVVAPELSSGDGGECWSDWGDEVIPASLTTPPSSSSSPSPSQHGAEGSVDGQGQESSLLLLRQEIRALKERVGEEVEKRTHDTATLEHDSAQRLAQARDVNQRALEEVREECEGLKENLYNALKLEGLHLSRINDLSMELDARSLQVKELESENESCRLVLAEKTKDIIEFKKLAELMQSNPDLETMAQELQELQRRYEQLKGEKEAISLEYRRLREEHLATPHTQTAAIQTHDDWASAGERGEKEAAAVMLLQQQLQQSEDLLGEASFEKSLILRDRDNLLRENGVVRDKLLEAENEISLLEGENADLLDRYEELRVRLYRIQEVDPSTVQRSADGAEGEEMGGDDDPLYYQNDAYVKSNQQTAPFDKSILLRALSNCKALKAQLDTLMKEFKVQRQQYTSNEHDIQHKCRVALGGMRAMWEGENILLKDKLLDLTSRLDASLSQCQDLKAENQDYHKRLHELLQQYEAEKAAKSDELATLQSQVDAKNRDLVVMQDECNRLKTESMGAGERLTVLLAEVERYKSVDALRDLEIKSFEAALRDGEQERSNLGLANTQLRQRFQELERELGEEREKSDSTRDSMNNLMSEIGLRDALVERLEQEMKEQREIGEYVKHKCTLYRNICQQLRDGCEGFKMQLRDLKASVLCAQQQAHVESVSRPASDPVLRSLLATVGSDGRLSDLQNTVTLLLDEKGALQSSLKSLKEEANYALSKKEDEIKQCADSLERVERECVELKVASRELEDLRGEIDRLKDHNNASTTSIKVLEAELEQARTTSLAKSETICQVASVQTEPLEMREEGDDVKRVAAIEMAYKEREDKMARELERLKGHLMKMEESYTTEALAAEEREVSLRQALATYREKANSLSSELSKYESQNENKLKNLSETLVQITTQRDKCVAQNTILQDDVCRLQSQITNLQLVLERVQKEKDDAISFEVRAITDRLEEKDRFITDMQQKAERHEAEAKKLGTLSKSYSFLNQRLAERETALNEARLQLIDQESTINDLRERIGEMEKKQGTAFEKEIFKNLFASYLSTSDEKKHEIGLLMAKILGFSPIEIDKMNPVNTHNSSSRWSFGLWGGSSPSKSPETSLPNDSKNISTDKGLSELFIQFLERESGPKNLPKFNLPQLDANHRGIMDPFETNVVFPAATTLHHNNLQQHASAPVATINPNKPPAAPHPQGSLRDERSHDNFSDKFD